MYKTFDVRYLKSKIWDSILRSDKEDDMTFKYILDSVTRSVSSEVRNNISAQTCFVCLLHLANEKGNNLINIDLNLEEMCESEFLIKNNKVI